MPRYPVDTVKVASGYGDAAKVSRATNHWAYDLAGYQPVLAPEGGEVVAVWRGNAAAADNTAANPPWLGYGPGGVELHGVTGVYHVLAHLDPGTLTVNVGDTVTEGELLGHTAQRAGAAAPHCHWEVRKLPIIPGSMSASDGSYTYDPAAWLGAAGAAIAPVKGAVDALTSGAPWWVWALVAWALAKGKS